MSLTDKLPIHLLLVDDDINDCYFFKEALEGLPILTKLTTVDGEGLTDYFSNNSDKLPDALFLDLNMPCKNGFECLTELKLNETLQDIPVIIYSTAFDELVADELYKNGAHHYIRKTDLIELKKVLHDVLNMMQKKKLERPPRNKFLFNHIE